MNIKLVGWYVIRNFNIFFCFFQVEMFGVTQNQGGDDLLLEFLEIEKQLFQNLGLHFR